MTQSTLPQQNLQCKKIAALILPKNNLRLRQTRRRRAQRSWSRPTGWSQQTCRCREGNTEPRQL